MSKLNYYINRQRIFAVYFFQKGKDGTMRLMIEDLPNPDRYWNKRKQRCHTPYKHSTKINKLLDVLFDYVVEVRMNCMISGIPFTPYYLKNKIKERLAGTSTTTFKSYADDWLSRLDVKPITKQTYDISVRLIDSILPGLLFDQVSRSLHSTLIKALNKKKYKPNYINRVLKVFRAILQAAYVDGVHDNKFHLTRGFVPAPQDVDSIYLTLSEIELLFNYWSDVTNPEYHRNAINIFLRGCYTGQRWQTYSDMNNLMIYEVNGVEMMNLRQEKTSSSVSVPVSKRLKILLGVDVKKISRQKLSDYVKLVCENCGIDKYKQVSTHTARRTFATNMILAGIDITRVMSITGHKTEKEFRKYVKMDGVLNATKTIHEINQIFG